MEDRNRSGDERVIIRFGRDRRIRRFGLDETHRKGSRLTWAVIDFGRVGVSAADASAMGCNRVIVGHLMEDGKGGKSVTLLLDHGATRPIAPGIIPDRVLERIPQILNQVLIGRRRNAL
jgi:hypothetical protein